jgi:PIN domain nuclease of toxin-antitoxin system
MKFLLDTHILLWWLGDEPKLSPQMRTVISNSENAILLVRRQYGKCQLKSLWVSYLNPHSARQSV